MLSLDYKAKPKRSMQPKGKVQLPSLKGFEAEGLSEAETKHKVCRSASSSLEFECLTEPKEKGTKG
jgi:hypothetical protein